MPRKCRRDHESLLQRLMDSCVPVPECGCWLWLKTCAHGGYGRLNVGYDRIVASRLSWTLFKGEIPIGLLVCHKCDTKSCVNPEHLFLGTTQENALDAKAKGRLNTARGIQMGTAKLNDEKAISIFLDHRYMAEIAADYGVSRTTVLKIKHRRTWSHVTDSIEGNAPIKDSCLRGEDSSSSKLTSANVLAIREHLARGDKQADIANRFGVHQTLISLIRLRRVWLSVGEAA